ncbi:MAG: PLP-dependent aminotransferase family protein [Eubacteriales bacterium]
MLQIEIVHNSQTPIYLQIANQIKELVIKGELSEGCKLPSERALAKATDVHRNTVIKAYNELKAGGLIVARQGLAYEISYGKNEAATSKNSGSIPWQCLMKEEFQELNESFDHLFSESYSKKFISFAGGIIPNDAKCKDDVREILTQIIALEESGEQDVYSYSPYQGILSFRQNLSRLLRGKGIHSHPGEIQVLTEMNQALDYIIELFIKPGDCVLTEEPISPDVFRGLKLAGAKVVTVPIDENGIIAESIESLVLRHKPKFIYVSSGYQDPTGTTLSLERKNLLLEISNKYRLPIVEDDSTSGICFERDFVSSIKSLDKHNQVIYIYSFELTFAPGIRLAFVSAPKQIIKRLSYLVSLHLISIDSLSQRLLSNYIEKGFYEKNLKSISLEYEKKMELMYKKLEDVKELGISCHKPKGGVYLWCRLPNNMKIKTLEKKAFKKGVVFIPGTLFYPHGNNGESYIRLNFSYPSMEQIAEGMDLLIEAMKESTGT